LVLRRLVLSAYRPVLANRVFRRLILGFAVSYLGDGMSFVAVAWLAILLFARRHGELARYSERDGAPDSRMTAVTSPSGPPRMLLADAGGHLSLVGLAS